MSASIRSDTVKRKHALIVDNERRCQVRSAKIPFCSEKDPFDDIDNHRPEYTKLATHGNINVD